MATQPATTPRTQFPHALVFLSGRTLLGRAQNLRFTKSKSRAPCAITLTLAFAAFSRAVLLRGGGPWRSLDLTLMAGATRHDGTEAGIRLMCEGQFLSLPGPLAGAPAVLRLTYIHASAGGLVFWETGRPRRLF